MRCDDHPRRAATWHLRYVCPIHNHIETYGVCGECNRVSLAYSPTHGETFTSHPLASECKHPESVWHPGGCIVPTTELTVEDLEDILAPA